MYENNFQSYFKYVKTDTHVTAATLTSFLVSSELLQIVQWAPILVLSKNSSSASPAPKVAVVVEHVGEYLPIAINMAFETSTTRYYHFACKVDWQGLGHGLHLQPREGIVLLDSSSSGGGVQGGRSRVR